ncbi:protein HGH1 homolog, partial [Onychostruthus taczanowskii]|uniref:protein HGH1 homolog n=1 Tax=Onychostruthus taczanowskii TaxID=356909 RepID=UPI001B7FF802
KIEGKNPEISVEKSGIFPGTRFPTPLEFPEKHEWLLGPEVDALPPLLLPLAGPEELPEDEMEQLPVDLQYLPPEHRREEEPEIRKMLLETLMLVGSLGVP